MEKILRLFFFTEKKRDEMRLLSFATKKVLELFNTSKNIMEKTNQDLNNEVAFKLLEQHNVQQTLSVEESNLSKDRLILENTSKQVSRLHPSRKLSMSLFSS